MSDALLELLQGRAASGRELVPPLPRGWTASLPQQDEEGEALEPDEQADELLSTALGIEYVDALGNASVRRINIRGLTTRGGDLFLTAWCFEREAFRHFRASSIQRAIDLRTGEILDDQAKVYLRFDAMLEAETATAEGRTKLAIRSCRPGLNVLTFLARCDGHQHPSETQILLRYVDHFAEAPGIDGDLATQSIRRIQVSSSLFDRSLRRLRFQGYTEMRRVARYCRQIIDADGALSEAEMQFAHGLDRMLRAG